MDHRGNQNYKDFGIKIKTAEYFRLRRQLKYVDGPLVLNECLNLHRKISQTIELAAHLNDEHFGKVFICNVRQVTLILLN